MTQSQPVETSIAAIRTSLVAILYDLDGTLVNTDPVHFRVWQELLQSVDLEIDEAFYRTRISGRLNPVIVQDLLPELSSTAGQQLIEQKEARFRQLASQLSPLPGLVDLIDWAIAHEMKQAVVTNAPTENVHHMLNALNLQSTFDQVVICEQLGIGKPDPAPYRYALEQFNLAPQQAIAFEDSPSGIRSAVGAGILTIGIASTQPSQALYDLGATLVIPDFTALELWAFLESRTFPRTDQYG